MAMEAGGGLGQQEESSRFRVRCDRAGKRAEVADEFEALRFAAAEGVERLAEGEVAEADGVV